MHVLYYARNDTNDCRPLPLVASARRQDTRPGSLWFCSTAASGRGGPRRGARRDRRAVQGEAAMASPLMMRSILK
jgi:hypothetical protein